MRCATCKLAVNETRKIVYSGKNICFCSQTCYASFLSKEKENEDRNFLYKTICRVFGITTMDAKLYAQVKKLKEKDNLSYKNITAILHYMYDIRNMTVYSPTLYYVPEHIEEAKEYYLNLRAREARTAQAIAETKALPTKVVRPNYGGTRTSKLKIDPSMV